MIVYFDLNNKDTLSNLDGDVKILKPLDFESNYGYGLDPIIKNIYTELYNRSFKISGLDVRFKATTYETLEEDNNIISLFKIKHADFSISFMGGYSGTICFQYKEREITLYPDESPISLYTYVGNDWEEDKDAFFNGVKCNSKLKNKKRIYLSYNCRDSIFVNDSDLNREYSPVGKEPKTIKKQTEINKLKNFLLSLLDELQELPESEFDLTVFDYEKTLLKEPLALKCFYESYTDVREERILSPSTRLINLSSRTPDGPFKDIYHDGFIYTEINNGQEEAGPTKEYVGWDSSKRYDVDIELKYSNSVYVLDLEPRDNFRNSINTSSKFDLFGDNTNKVEKEVSKEEKIFMYNGSLVSKMCKVEDYDGSYMKPIYIINRLIREDEIKKIVKCKTKDYKIA